MSNDNKNMPLRPLKDEQTRKILKSLTEQAKTDFDKLSWKQKAHRLEPVVMFSMQALKAEYQQEELEKNKFDIAVKDELIKHKNQEVIEQIQQSSIPEQQRDDNNGIENRFQHFMNEREGEIDSGYFDLHKVVYRYFTELFGVKNVRDYTYEDALAFKKTVVLIPKYPNNWMAYFGTTDLVKVLELNKKIKKPTVSKNTYNKKYLAIINTFFNWCEDRKFVTQSIFRNMNYTAKPHEKNKSKKMKRQPFNIQELNTIFNSPDFTSLPRDFLYFGPLVLLFSGMRFSELAQLRIKDIVEHNGYKHFDLTGTDKVLKTDTSYRYIPLHEELIKVGFLDFVEEQKKRKKDKSSKIFDVNFNTARNSYDSRRLTRFLEKFKENGQLRKTVVVHSFRHSYRNGLVSSGVDSESIAMAMGHSFKDVESGEDYNDGEIKKVQSEKVLGLKYEGLDISHLYI
ncbi:tyrosine-type recombinase/integrase [Thalassospira sp. ER-Se-21-Dark]|uniref:tyrosine-type recombinase/integrase n=1 Tax=Thalassospira sp. ER-Se-21-Dark TaxID=2585190 RepID=UPI001B308F1A|nr:tyrosine-type recombinase/integrase [Thalassospira sp. ER-Se-21-Dark]